MATFIMLTKLNPEARLSTSPLHHLAEEILACIRRDCPGVEWKQRFAVLGRIDILDVFSAPDIESAMKVATIVRTMSHAATEVWGATDWAEFIKLATQPLSAPRPIRQSDYLFSAGIPPGP